MLGQKIIRLEKQRRDYFSKLISDKRFLLLVFAVIFLMGLPILYAVFQVLSSPIFFALIILTVIFVVFGIYIGSSSRIIFFDNERIELRFSIFTQSSLWKSISSIDINIDTLTRKEQIQLNQTEGKKSWAMLNLDYTSDSWTNAKQLVIQYAKGHKIKVRDQL